MPQNLPMRCAVIFGGVNQNPQVQELQKGVDILVATPGRLNDLIGQGHVRLEHLNIFVLDEADRMLDMGFIHDVKKVIAKLPEKRQTLLFSATMPREVEELALNLLHDPVTVKIAPALKTVDAIAQSVYFTQKADKFRTLLWLLEEHKMDTALVFTRTKHGANQVATKLMKSGVQALAIHGNKSQNARQEALGRFKKGTLRVLVATDIAARGIDVAQLPFVINFNVPDTPETYVHRIGRTGRAGLEGAAITLVCGEELKDWQDIEKHTKQSVPRGECPWSMADLQPIDPPPKERGGQRQKVAEPRRDTPKAKGTPKVPEKPKAAPTPKADKPQPSEKKKADTPRPTPPAPKKAPSPKAEPPKQETPADILPAPRTRSAYGAAYAARYGSRPVRPFQSRVSLEPKAEDFPPPEATAGVSRLKEWSAEDLPERRPVADISKSVSPKSEDEVQKCDESAPKKRRRHRGGRRHHKPKNNNA